MIYGKKHYDSVFSTVLRGSSKRQKSEREAAENRQGPIPASTLKAMLKLGMVEQSG